MDTCIVHKPRMTVTGVSARTTNKQEAGPDGVLPKLWETYFNSGIAAQADIMSPHLIYALYTDYEKDATGAYTVVIGHETDCGRLQADNSKTCAVIPESKYLVFTTEKGAVHEVVPLAWARIWDYFRDSPEIRTFTGDFEVYDTRHFDPANVELQIYIAVR